MRFVTVSMMVSDVPVNSVRLKTNCSPKIISVHFVTVSMMVSDTPVNSVTLKTNCIPKIIFLIC